MLTDARATTRRTALAADIGGTFTDVVLETRDGYRTSSKVLTTPAAPERGLLKGIETVLMQAELAPADLDIIIHGTTLATNALIERKGARTALVTTAGFGDVLEMGFEKRYAHYDLAAPMPAPLVPRPLRFEVPERRCASGETLIPLDESALHATANALRAADVEAVAIGFLHAYAWPSHEHRAAELLRAALPGVAFSLSSEVCPEMREYERFSTTCANAYVQPLVAGYLGRLNEQLAGNGYRCPLFLMMSGGGLTTLEQAMACPIRLVESGPAGGAVLAAHVASARSIDKALAFDMGGTTAKVCLIDSAQPERARRFEVARVHRDMKGSGLPLRIPVIEMVEIGAGGGSIANVDAMGRITVGPHSAGASPGPVAYGCGGTAATVTDANLVLGKLDPRHFAGGKIALDADAARNAIANQIGTPLGLDGRWPATGVVEMVEENMANAARVHAIERGKEASEYTMIAFGGGAPLHAAELARKLGIGRVVVPVGAGVGSAIGFLRAPVAYEIVRSYQILLDDADIDAINAMLNDITTRTTDVVRAGASGAQVRTQRAAELRYRGQGHELAVPLPSRALLPADMTALRDAFEERYRRVYGLVLEDVAVEAVSWSVSASTQVERPWPVTSNVQGEVAVNEGTRPLYDAALQRMVDAAVYSRATLAHGSTLQGPALITEDETTTVVPSGAVAQVDSGGALVIDIALAETGS